MQSDVEERIRGERAQITALDSTLGAKRTPYLKGQLRSASGRLDDAMSALRLAAKAQPEYVYMWLDFAEMNIQTAAQTRQKVKALVDRYGGPDHVLEVGG